MPVTDAVRRLAAVVIYQLSVNAMPLTVSPVTERESSSMSVPQVQSSLLCSVLSHCHCHFIFTSATLL